MMWKYKYQHNETAFFPHIVVKSRGVVKHVCDCRTKSQALTIVRACNALERARYGV